MHIPSKFFRRIAPVFGVIFLLSLLGCDYSGSEYARQTAPHNDLDPEVARLISPEKDGNSDLTSTLVQDGSAHREKQSANDVPTSQERKLISTADLRLRVEDVEKTGTEIHKIISNAGGYVAKEEFTRDSYSQQISATLRVPAQSFDKAVKDIATLAVTVESKNVQVEDVTEEFVDVSARLAAKKDVETRYRELLKQARNVSEILEIEGKIGKVRAEIESAEGRLKYLTNRIGYSTINAVWFVRSAASMSEDSFGARLAQGLQNGWNGVILAVIVAVNAWPAVILLLFFIYFMVRISRKARRKSRAAAIQQANVQS